MAPADESKESKRSFEAIDAIHRNGNHLLSIINDLLDLAKLEVGKVEIEIEPIDLNILFKNLVDQMKSLLDQHNVDFSYSCPEHGEIMADELRLKQILLNLVSNAVKYGNGKVALLAERALWLEEGKEFVGWKIVVTDNGDGISEEDKKLLFKPYSQLKRAHQSSGTGLGLAISAEYAKLHHGQLTIDSKPGETIVTLLIPDQIS